MELLPSPVDLVCCVLFYIWEDTVFCAELEAFLRGLDAANMGSGHALPELYQWQLGHRMGLGDEAQLDDGSAVAQQAGVLADFVVS